MIFLLSFCVHSFSNTKFVFTIVDLDLDPNRHALERSREVIKMDVEIEKQEVQVEKTGKSSQQNGTQQGSESNSGTAVEHPSWFELALVVVTVCIASMLAMSDQTGITLLLSFISEDLASHKSIQWVGTGALICSTIFNIMVGRLVNIFGNKTMLIISLAIISLFEALCFFVDDKIAFYICRSITGFGNGGIVSISMVIMSDVVPIKQRGISQGILGLALGIGSCIGPFIASSFVSHSKMSGWRKYFFFMGLMFLFMLILSLLTIPNTNQSASSNKYSNQSRKQKWKSIDYGGLFFSTITVILALIPLNMGGILWDWGSLKIILCSVFSIISLVLLLIVEYKNSEIALVPPKLFNNFKISNLLLQTFLVSIIYSSMIYYIPFFLTAIQEKKTTQVPYYFLALLVPLSFSSFLSGYLTSILSHQKYVIVSGFSLLFIGVVLLSVLLDSDTSDVSNILIFFLIGVGAGFVFTPTTVAIQKHVEPDEKSVVLSTKGVSKTLGQSVGVAVSSMVYSNTLLYQLEKLDLQTKEITYILTNLNRKVSLSYVYTGETLASLETIYSNSLKNVFLTWIPLAIICLILSLLIQEEATGNSSDNGKQ